MDSQSGVALRKLGELLLSEGAITEDQLAAAIEEQAATGERLGEILLARRNVSRLDLANAFAEQHAAQRSAAAPRSATAGPSEADAGVASRVEALEALLVNFTTTMQDLRERLAALEALVPAIREALDSRAG